MTESVAPSPGSFQVPDDVLQGGEFTVVSDRRPAGVLPAPDVSTAPVTYLKPRERVATSGYHLDPLDGRIYLRLADGRGWVAQCSRKDPTKLALANTSLAMDVAALNSAGRALLIASKKRRIVMTSRCLGSGRGPVVPRARRKQVIGGPLHGATVQAEFTRARQCTRGYIVCPLFFLPGEERPLRGAGATRRLWEMVRPWAPRLLQLYNLLRSEMLQEWSRFNFWDDDRNRWVRRSKESWGVAARGGGLWRSRRKREEAPSPNTQTKFAQVPSNSCAIEGDLVVRDAAQQDHNCARFMKAQAERAVCHLPCHGSTRIRIQRPRNDRKVPAACAQQGSDSSAKSETVDEAPATPVSFCSWDKQDLARTTTYPSMTRDLPAETVHQQNLRTQPVRSTSTIPSTRMLKADVPCSAECDKISSDHYADPTHTVPLYRVVLEPRGNGMATVVCKRRHCCVSGDSVPRATSEGLVKQGTSSGSLIAARLRDDPGGSEPLERLSAKLQDDPRLMDFFKDVGRSSGALPANGCQRSPVCPIEMTLCRGRLRVQTSLDVGNLSYPRSMAEFEKKPRPSCRTAASSGNLMRSVFKN